MTDRELMQQALEALEAMNPYPASKEDQRANAITALRTALAEQPAEPQDPVAYNGWVLREVLFDNGEPVGHREPTKAEPQEPVAWCHLQYNEDGTYFADCLQHYPDSYGNTPLYAAPQPAKREPLTEAQICSTLATAFPDDAEPDGSWKLAQYELGIFRLAERAHGIGEKPDAA